MSRELRLKATGETLTWQDAGRYGEELLAPKNNIFGWYARADALGAAAYLAPGDSNLDDNDPEFVVPIFCASVESFDVDTAKTQCESALIEAGIVEVTNA